MLGTNKRFGGQNARKLTDIFFSSLMIMAYLLRCGVLDASAVVYSGRLVWWLWRERVLSITIGALASSQQEAAKSYTDNSKPHENQRPGHLKAFTKNLGDFDAIINRGNRHRSLVISTLGVPIFGHVISMHQF